MGLVGVLSTLSTVPILKFEDTKNPTRAKSTRRIFVGYEYLPSTLVISNVGYFDGSDCDDENAEVERGLVVLLNIALAGPHCSNTSGGIEHSWSQDIENPMQSVTEGISDFDTLVEVCCIMRICVSSCFCLWCRT
jgi:hypothetical protein